MALNRKKDLAIKLRLKGSSYSQIKNEINVSKSTLSMWLKDYPLSKQRVSELRGNNERRIENFIMTMQGKKDRRLSGVYQKISNEIGFLKSRELFLAGLFLYWGEGAKSSPYELSVSNTDPSMIRFVIRWYQLLGIPKDKIRLTLHIYKDMNPIKQVKWWSEKLRLPKSAFTKPYVKKTSLSDITYKTGFSQGTCMIRTYNRDIAEPVHMALKYLREELFAPIA